MPVDISQFQKALQLRARVTKREERDIINRALLNVAYRAAQFTDVAQAADIKSGLYRDNRLRYALTSLRLKGEKLKSPDFQKAVDAFVAYRIGSRRYLRSGWAKPIIDLGGTFRGSRLKKGTEEGWAQKASVFDLVARLAVILKEPNESKAKSAEDVLFAALQEAVDFVAQDMIQHDTKKLIRAIEEGE